MLGMILIFLNEYLAINIVVSILDSYINSDDRPERKFKHKIIQPEPFPVDDSDYMLDICIGLHYSNIKHFDPILFANTLFLWEKYSCRKKQCDNLNSEKTVNFLFKHLPKRIQKSKEDSLQLYDFIHNKGKIILIIQI